jgi:oligoribonuclease NrnB/cAMP/cGMP phosphodiesterase (DHH superfamily)
MKPIVIYHKGCADGIGAAWCFWSVYGDSMEYIEGVYQTPPPDVTGRDVYLLDFSYKRNVVADMCMFANKVTLIDHHITALEDLWDLSLNYKNFDLANSSTKHSGARLAWDYVLSKNNLLRERPKLIDYIEDRDLWKFKLPNTREIMMSVFSYPLSIEQLDVLMTFPIQQFINEGQVLVRKQNRDIKELIKTTERSMTLDGHLVKVYNVNYFFASDLGSLATLNEPFVATYFDTKDYRVFSLRSSATGLDVSEIARKYGGGGHREAAGFRVPRNHELAMC